MCVFVCFFPGGESEGRVFRVSVGHGAGRTDHAAGPHRVQEHSVRVSTASETSAHTTQHNTTRSGRTKPTNIRHM